MGDLATLPCFFFFPRSPLQEVISLRNPITVLSGSLRPLSVAEDYLLLLLLSPYCACPLVELPTGGTTRRPLGGCSSTSSHPGSGDENWSLQIWDQSMCCGARTFPFPEDVHVGLSTMHREERAWFYQHPASRSQSSSFRVHVTAWSSVPFSRMLSRFPWAIHCLASAFPS